MAEKMPVAVLISGRGRTLKNLLDKIEAGELDVEISVVIASSQNASGMQYAEKAGIPVEVIESSKFADNAEFSKAIFRLCRMTGVRYVVLAGWLSFITIPEDFEDRVLNIHPSLIPSFCGKGMYGGSVHEQALERGVKVSGCTVHFADNVYDNGPIVCQKVVPVLDGDTVETLSDRVLFDAEFVAYPEVLQALAERRVQVMSKPGSTRKVVRVLPKN